MYATGSAGRAGEAASAARPVGRDLRGLVDPGWAWRLRGNQLMANKAFGVGGVRGLWDACPLDLDTVGATEMDRGRGVKANTRVAVLAVVPPE